MNEEIKISIPLFKDGELENFDNNIHSIVEEYSKMLFKEKEQILTQRLIMKQEEEIEKLKLLIVTAIRIYEDCAESQDYSTCDLDMYECLKGVYKE